MGYIDPKPERQSVIDLLATDPASSQARTRLRTPRETLVGADLTSAYGPTIYGLDPGNE